MLLRVAPMLIFFAVMMSQGGRDSTGFLVYLCLFGAFMAMVLGPQMARSDLRQDLAALATLKTWPMRGATIVRGEVMAPALVLTTVIYLCLSAAAIVAVRIPATNDLPDRWGWLIAAFFPAVCGGVEAWYTNVVDTETAFNTLITAKTVIYAVAGGLGTVSGPILGAVAMVWLDELIWRQFPLLNRRQPRRFGARGRPRC